MCTALPAQIVEVRSGAIRLQINGVIIEAANPVRLGLEPGDWVLTYANQIIEKMTPAEALSLRELLQELGSTR
jgi:hydrogenase maturation factor